MLTTVSKTLSVVLRINIESNVLNATNKHLVCNFYSSTLGYTIPLKFLCLFVSFHSRQRLKTIKRVHSTVKYYFITKWIFTIWVILCMQGILIFFNRTFNMYGQLIFNWNAVYIISESFRIPPFLNYKTAKRE